MIKKFTLLLLAMLCIAGTAKADPKLVFVGPCALDYTGNLIIPSSTFSGITAGTKITMIVKDDAWCKLVNPGSWTKIEENNASGKKFEYTIKAEDLSGLTTDGLCVQGSTTLLALYLGNENDVIEKKSGIDHEFTSGWGSPLDFNETKAGIDPKTINIGDKLTFDVSDTGSGWQPLAIQSKDTWRSVEVNTEGKESVSLYVDFDLYSILHSENGCNITGQGYTLNKVSYADNKCGSSTVSFKRTYNAGWNSLCLPFNTNVSQISANATLYTLSSLSGEDITFTKVEGGAIVAGVPYMLWNSGEELSPTIDADLTTVAIVSSTEEVSGLKMFGNYTPEMDMKGKFGVVKYNGEWKIMKGGEGATLKPFSAYFEYSGAGASSRGLSIVIGDGTTSIEKIENIEEEKGDIYNLMGVKTTSVRKGIYIKNGKKYVVK